MKKLFVMVYLVVCAILPQSAMADGKTTAEEAKALTLKAAEFVAANGLDEARKVFHKEGEFFHGQIYAGVLDFEGHWLVYPPKPAAEGTNAFNVRDPNGIYLVRECIKIAKEKGEGWLEYSWWNPEVNQIRPKKTFVKRIPGKNLLAYVGIYS